MAGRLYALSTAGSLVGTLVSALLLIPLVGTRRTFLVFALAIAVVAVLGLRPVRRWALAPAAIVVLIALPVGTLKAKTEDGGRVIHEAETEYQYARVVEYPSGKRTLELNEGQAEHSVCEAECDAGPRGPREPSSVLTGNYWDGMLVDSLRGPRRAAAAGRDPRQRRRHDLARVRGVLPAHARRRRGDRPGAVRDRPPVLRHEQPAAAPLPRGRAAVPAAHRRELRRDLGGRLPPALHPVLPDDQGVLRDGRATGSRRTASCS